MARRKFLLTRPTNMSYDSAIAPHRQYSRRRAALFEMLDRRVPYRHYCNAAEKSEREIIMMRQTLKGTRTSHMCNHPHAPCASTSRNLGNIRFLSAHITRLISFFLNFFWRLGISLKTTSLCVLLLAMCSSAFAVDERIDDYDGVHIDLSLIHI